MEVAIYVGGYNLASIDSESLTVVAYLRFCGIDFVVQYKDSSFADVVKLPILKDQDTLIYGLDNIMQYLVKKGYDLDKHANLTELQIAQSKAFAEYVKKALNNGKLCSWWLEEDNFKQHTYGLYSKGLPWPLNTILMREQRAVISHKLVHAYEESKEERVKGKIYDEFQSCLTNLTNILASKFFSDEHYFHGNQPSSIDAYLYGFLGPIIHIDTPTNNLKSYIKSDSTVLSRYCENITQNYFLNKPAQINFVLNEGEPESTDTNNNNNNASGKTKASKPSGEDQQRRKENILFLGGSAFAILGYMAFQFIKAQAEAAYYEDEYDEE